MLADGARLFDQPEQKDRVRRGAIARVLTAESFFVVSIDVEGKFDFHALLDGKDDSEELLLKIYELVKDRLPDG